MLSRNEIQVLISRMIRPVLNRVMMVVARGVLEAVKDAGGIQLVKAEFLEGETKEDVERMQQFGFSSNPPPGSEVVAVFVGGNREHGFIIACDHREFRFKPLESGEMAIYTDDGTHIHLKKAGHVEVKAATKVTLDVPDTLIKGDLKVEGKVDADGDVLSGGKVSAAANVEAGGKVTATLDVETMADVKYGPGAGSSLTALKTGFNTHTHLAGAVPPPDSPVLP